MIAVIPFWSRIRMYIKTILKKYETTGNGNYQVENPAVDNTDCYVSGFEKRLLHIKDSIWRQYLKGFT